MSKGNDAAPVIELKVMPEQADFITCRARFIGFFAGRRYGKTFAIALRLVLRATTEPGFQAWYSAPSYGQCFEVYQAVAFNPELQPWIKGTRQQPYPFVTFVNGSRIGFRSFDRPANLKGSGLDEVCLDEIQDVNERDFWPVVRPLLSDRRGTLVVSGQFRGLNWFYRTFYEKGLQQGQPLYKSFRLPSSKGICFQSDEGKAELELARSQLPRVVYLQEYECEPVANQNAVFDPLDLDAARRGVALVQAAHGRHYILGLDLGRIADPTAVVVLEAETNTVVHAERRPLKERHEIQSIHVAQIAKRFNAAVICDVTGGATGGHAESDAFVKFYRAQMPQLREFVWSRQNKTRIVHALAFEIEQRRMAIPAAHQALHDELGLYEYEYKNGIYDFHGPSGHTDDLVAALAMANYARIKNWGPQTSGAPLGALLA